MEEWPQCFALCRNTDLVLCFTFFLKNNFYVIPDDKAHFQFYTPPNVSIVFGLQLPNDWTVSHTDSIHWKITSYLYRLTKTWRGGEQMIKRKPSPFFLYTRKNPRILDGSYFLLKYSHQIIFWKNEFLFQFLLMKNCLIFKINSFKVLLIILLYLIQF